MKLQCACGAKYAFDLTPEMARQPVKFVCPGCGLDSSDFVNELVRRELAEAAPTMAMPPGSSAPPVPAAETPRLKISRAETPAATPAETPVAGETSKFCPRHLREPVTDHCAVCKKPICPKCMEMFGYFCSVLCKAKAEAQKIDVPAYAGQKSAVEARFWRKTGLIIGLLIFLVVAALGCWTWYAWFGSVPHPYFSVRFEGKSYSGRSQLAGREQIVFLHGGTLARYDLKTKKKVWSQELVTPQQVAGEIKREDDLIARENQRTGGGFGQAMTPDRREQRVRNELEGELSLRVSGQNVWVGKLDKLTHYDWDSGKVLQEVSLPADSDEVITRDDELLLLRLTEVGAQFVTHLNLANGEMRTEEFHEPGVMTVASTQNAGAGAGSADSPATGGLPLAPGANNGQPLDPAKVAAQAQNLTLPARIALPALLGNAAHEQQLEAALKDSPSQRLRTTAPQQKGELERFTLVPGQDGYVQFAVRLLESHIVTREAMKAPPKKSALDGDLNASKTAEVANETLNEMQRNNGGDKVSEDESRYQVTLRRPDSTAAADWTGEVTGPPQLFPLKTVNVLTAGKTVIVFDRTNKKLWQAALTYNVAGGGGGLSREALPFGEGPCAEHGGTLYVFDQAVLSAFDLSTGNARWRLPTIGVVGLFFDDQGMVYVNTTTGNPDDIKYSRQIDVTRSTDAVLLKIDPRTGRALWNIKPGGFISYLSGKFIYTVQSYDPGDDEALSDTMAGLQKPPYLRIARINPQNGRVLWEHYQERAPLDVRFSGNSIELVFKKEVQVLKYLAF